MKVVILAAGRGTRMGTLVTGTPKPLLLVKGKPILERLLASLPEIITECVIVLGYLGEIIRSHFGTEYAGLRIRYVFQDPSLSGTGGALLAAKDLLQNEVRFLVIGGDNLYEKRDLEVLLKLTKGYGLYKVASTTPNQQSVQFTKSGRLLAVRGSFKKEYRYVGVGAYSLTPEYFKVTPVCLDNGELSIPHTLTKLEAVRVCKFRYWLQIDTPAQLLIAGQSHL